jgi:hypothetical protein
MASSNCVLEVANSQYDARKCLHDPRVYSNPFQFNPERFLAAKGRTPEADPREVCFGFGRRQVILSRSWSVAVAINTGIKYRICPGTYSSVVPITDYICSSRLLSCRFAPRRRLSIHFVRDGLGCLRCFPMRGRNRRDSRTNS